MRTIRNGHGDGGFSEKVRCVDYCGGYRYRRICEHTKFAPRLRIVLHPGRAYPADAGASLEALTRFDVTGSGMDGMVRLETHRLRLRPVQPRDLDSLSALNGDPAKMKYISPPLSRHQVKEALDWMIEEWRRIGYGWFAILEKSSRAFVGQIGLQCFEYDPRSAETELAFVIKKSAWGKGYAREAAEEVLRFGFERHQFEKIVSVIAPDNPATQAILRKLGFDCTGERTAYGHRVMYFEITRDRFLG
jgi:RimJ/RimL family protein N-acetyltransferase